MFSRWMFVRLKAAQRALDDGRLDEACERLNQPDLRDTRRARPLVAELARALLARARLHARAGRYREALADLDQIAAFDASNEESEALRQRVEQEHHARIDRQARHEHAAHDAAERIRAGRIETGRLAIERIEDPARREQLRDELEMHAQRGRQLVERATTALDSGDWLAACRLWDEAVTRHGRSQASDALSARLVPACRQGFEKWLKAGQLEQLRAALEYTTRLRQQAPELDAFNKLGELLDRAGAELATRDYTALRTTLAQLQALAGEASWLTRATRALAGLLEAESTLFASPLGLLSVSGPAPQGGGASADVATAREAPTTVVSARGAPLGADPLLMLVDGTGSSLLIAGDIVKIGRAGGMTGIDVPIPADIQSHHMDIEREGGDYFLVAHGPTTINGRTASRALLRHGDRIVLGQSAKLTFCQPSAKSESAVLMLSSRNRLPLDISSVVLFRDTCLLGPQSSCHVRTREGDTRVVLFERRGRLWARATNRDGRPTGPAVALKLDQTSDIGDQRLTVKRYEPGAHPA